MSAEYGHEPREASSTRSSARWPQATLAYGSRAAGRPCRGAARRRPSRCRGRTRRRAPRRAGSRPRPRGVERLARRRAPCGTAASWSSPRRRRRRPGSGRSAGCPRRPAGRRSRCRPTARGGGGRRRGSARSSGRSRTIMSPSTTCCWTISYSSAVSLPGLRRMWSGIPILPTSWSRPATRNGLDESGSAPIRSARKTL